MLTIGAEIFGLTVACCFGQMVPRAVASDVTVWRLAFATRTLTTGDASSGSADFRDGQNLSTRTNATAAATSAIRATPGRRNRDGSRGPLFWNSIIVQSPASAAPMTPGNHRSPGRERPAG